jgi:hypothetical protein
MRLFLLMLALHQRQDPGVLDRSKMFLYSAEFAWWKRTTQFEAKAPPAEARRMDRCRAVDRRRAARKRFFSTAAKETTLRNTRQSAQAHWMFQTTVMLDERQHDLPRQHLNVRIWQNPLCEFGRAALEAEAWNFT